MCYCVINWLIFLLSLRLSFGSLLARNAAGVKLSKPEEGWQLPIVAQYLAQRKNLAQDL